MVSHERSNSNFEFQSEWQKFRIIEFAVDPIIKQKNIKQKRKTRSQHKNARKFKYKNQFFRTIRSQVSKDSKINRFWRDRIEEL